MSSSDTTDVAAVSIRQVAASDLYFDIVNVDKVSGARFVVLLVVSNYVI